MPSVNWREVADNWFGACCCSFGGVSEKLVNKYANSYSCAEGTCLLNATSIILCKDDLVGCKFSDLGGSRKYVSETDSVCYNGSIGTIVDSRCDRAKEVFCEKQSYNMHDVNGKLSSTHLKNEDFAANQECEATRKEINGDGLFCAFSALNISEPVALTECCIDTRSHALNHDHDHVHCTHDVTETSQSNQKPAETMELLANQKSFLNGFLADVFMLRSSNLSRDVEWIEFLCPQCSSLVGVYPCGSGHEPLDSGVRLFKCYISTCLPIGGSSDMFRKYTLERMFTSQLLDSAKDELSFRTVVRDLRTKSPVLKIVLLNPNSWCCSGYCLGTEGTMEQVSKIDLCPVIKVLFSDCSKNAEYELRMIDEWVTKNLADEVYVLQHQIKELTETLELAKDVLPPSVAFLQGLPLSSMRR